MKGQIIFQDIEKWTFQIYFNNTLEYFWGLGWEDLLLILHQWRIWPFNSQKKFRESYPYFILLKADIKPNDKIRYIKHKLNIYLLINIDMTTVRRLCFVVVVEMTCIRGCIVFSLLMSVTQLWQRHFCFEYIKFDFFKILLNSTLINIS